MGVKRPLDEENLPELSFEHPKHLDNNKKLAYTPEDFSSHATAPEVDSPGKEQNGFRKLHSDEVLESGHMSDSFIENKENEASEEDAVIKNCSFFSNLQHYVDFNMPYRPPNHFVDSYIYLLSVPPKKEIPVGPDNQAEVPKWDPSASVKAFPANNLMGTRITPMPGLNDSNTDGFTVGRGRTTDCSCIDMGSIRCVQQHVREAREKLRYTLGDETFKMLGFYEMGEEIEDRWSSKDQELFHNVVCSSSGGNFWRHFSFMFPTRSKKELVSYYFNVFVLRRRAAQNRAYLSQIDSDHEELNVACEEYPKNRPLVDDDAEDHHLFYTNGEIVIVRGDEDLEVESFVSDEELEEWVAEFGNEPENRGGDEGSNVNGTCDGNAVNKDGVDEGRIDNHGISDGKSSKEDAVEMDGEAAKISGPD